jgi:hypothetical protein
MPGIRSASLGRCLETLAAEPQISKGSKQAIDPPAGFGWVRCQLAAAALAELLPASRHASQ